MATRRSSAADKKSFTFPITVSNDDLLVDGSDHVFRTWFYDMSYLATLFDVGRREMGAVLDVTGPQYTLLMTIGEKMGRDGISVGEVAEHLHFSGPHVTTEVIPLVKKGLVRKIPNPADKRGILLRLTPKAEKAIEEVIDRIRGINARFFGSLTRRELVMLHRICRRLIVDGELMLSEQSTYRKDTRRWSRNLAYSR